MIANLSQGNGLAIAGIWAGGRWGYESIYKFFSDQEGELPGLRRGRVEDAYLQNTSASPEDAPLIPPPPTHTPLLSK